jgi:hypothetical protein
MSTSIGVTWDYRCPFARNAHEHLLVALEGGADWDVTFLAFSLDQAHVAEGSPPVWDEPDRYPGLLANQAGIVVRDREPDRFFEVHRALFSARHDRALDLRDRNTVRRVLDESGVDGTGVLSEMDDGWPLDVFRKEHEEAVNDLDVFGVPTFILDDRAVFVRLMNRPQGDVKVATSSIERVIDLMRDWPELNEFKYTRISR